MFNSFLTNFREHNSFFGGEGRRTIAPLPSPVTTPLILNVLFFCCSLQTWTDVLMTWDPDNFGGVDKVRVPRDRIWTPDIVLYN